MTSTDGQQEASPAKRPWRALALAGAGYLALSLLLLTPPLLNLSGEIIGYPDCTNRMHVWVLWVVNQLIFQGYSPVFTNYIFYPSGANLILLYGSDLFYPVVLGPLVALLSAAAVFNLKLIFSFTLAPLGVFALLRHLRLGTAAAWVGGALFISAPYYLLETFNGVSELVAVEWVPFAALYLLRSLEPGGRRRDALLFALFALMAAYASGYNIFFLFFLGTILLVGRIIGGWRSLPWRRLLLMGALCGVGMVPLGLLHREGQTSTRVQEEHMDMFDPGTTARMDSSAALVRFFRPGKNTIPWVKRYGDGTVKSTNTTYSVYLGYGVLALCLVGLVARRRSGALLWGGAGLFFLLLCLGPHLWIGQERLLIGGKIVPMPAYLLYKIMPGFDVTLRHSYRYVAMAHLALAVLAAMGLEHLIGKGRTVAARRGIAAAALVICVAEFLAVGPSPWPLPRTSTAVPAYYHELAAEQGAFPIVELPYSDFLNHLQPILMAQTVHGKKLIAGAVHHRLGQEELRLINGAPLARNWMREEDIARPLSNAEIALSVRALQVAKFRYVVVRDRDFKTPASAAAANTHLAKIFGAPALKPGQIKVYDVRKVDVAEIENRDSKHKKE